MNWAIPRPFRREVHFGTRVVRCYVDRPSNADGLLREAAATWPVAEALVDGERRYQFNELDRRVEHVAANLSRLGLALGDRIALFFGNSAEFVVTVLATTRLGAVIVPISPRLQKPEVAHIMADCGARFLVADAALAHQIPDRAVMPDLDTIIAVDGEIEGAARYEHLTSPGAAPRAAVAEDAPYAILYTSGTTGTPKGAVLTNLGIVHAAMQFADCWNLQPGERCILAVPASHATGIGAVIATMMRVGGCIIVMRSFKARDFLVLAERERLSYAAMAPAMYNLLLLDPALHDFKLAAWRVGGYGAAPMPLATIAALADKFPKLQLVNAYGATETTAPPLLMPLGQTACHPQSVGCAVPTAEIMVADDAGREVARGETGEIWMRGPTISPGYWRNAAANADSFADGWWKSGDMGAFEEDGFLRVLDRKKDMIIRGGYKVFSAEVENVLAMHPEVLECAVVAQSDSVLGERVHAFIVARGSSLEAQSLTEWCATRLADYKQPETYTISTELLPRNPTGKVLKQELRSRLASSLR